jgi:AraC family transcriptional regulator
MKEKDEFTIFGIRHYLNLAILEFYRHNRSAEVTVGPSLANIIKAIQYIRQNLNTELRVTELADMCGYSPEYFTRLFKKYVGSTPKSYIINMRIEKVLNMISTENITIMGAAFECGFLSSSSFYKAFKAYKSKPPLKYRKFAYQELPPPPRL